ncbi:MAG TPA: hypothetical protein VNZ58_09140 [Thermomicrobiales bacterium]|nr:hypothetical protein [Thermomicrobiales bacterium]
MNADVPNRTPFTDSAEPRTGWHNTIQVKNRIQVGPIIGGIVLAITVMLILTVLGLAVGASALKPRDIGEKVGIGAAIWGIVSAIIALFIGGWLAAKTSAVGGVGSGIVNGLLVGAGVLVILIWLTSSGFGALLGVLGNNLGDLANVIQNSGVTQNQAQQATDQAQQAANQVDVSSLFDTAKDSAWWTLLGLILMLAAGAVGGWVGHNEDESVIQNA